MNLGGKERVRIVRNFFVAAVVVVYALVAQPGPLQLYDIVPFSPGNEAVVVDDILRTHRETGLEIFLYSVSLDPRGNPAKENVHKAIESYRRIRDGIKGSDVKLGFLLQSILGHWKRVDREVEPWQRSIDVDGNPQRFCILDERFRAYIRDVAVALASEKPCFILGDDDIRAYSGGKLECFCPLHTAEFNRRTGHTFTPEQYRDAVKSAMAGDAIATVCSALRDEIPVLVSETVRKGIDSVDAAIPSGSCMPGVATARMVPRVRAMCAGHPAVMRFANGHYAEFGRLDISAIAVRTQLYNAYYRDKIDVMLDESDTFPHTSYSRGGRSYHAKLSMAFFLGLDGAKLWYVGMHRDGQRIPESLDRVFARQMPFYKTLHEAVRGSRSLGVRLPAREPVASHPLRPEEGGFAMDEQWALNCLCVYGIPFYVDFSVAPGSVVLVESDKMVNSLAPTELDSLLSGRVFVAGPAVRALVARGRAGDIGCRPVAGDVAYTVERTVEGRVNLAISKEETVCPLGDLEPGAEKISELCFSVSGNGTGAEAVAVGSAFFFNARGGRICSSAFTVPNCHGFNDQNPGRKKWLSGLLRHLDPGFPPILANDEPNLTLVRKASDGALLVYTLNLSYDEIMTPQYLCCEDVSSVEVLSCDGSWQPLRVKRAGDVISFDYRLAGFECAVFRFRL